jgi:hypothetical protein
MPPAVTIGRLAPLSLPADWGLARDPVIPPSARAADHDARYDATTLVYGAIWRPDRRALVLVAPPLRNLAELIPEMRFASEKGPHPLRRHRRFRRIDEIWLDAPERPGGLEISLRSERFALPVGGPLPGFAGLRTTMTISQDNELGWIADWTRHLVRNQGVEAMLFADNRSTLYPPEALAEVFAGIGGLRVAHVLSVDQPYGPMATKPPRGAALFLQTGLLQLCRHGWLREAGAVLHCDIDELLVSDRETLFDRALGSRLGYATARCLWRYRDPAAQGTPGFGDHILRRVPQNESKEKWIVRPHGPLGDTLWEPHGVAGYWLNRLARHRGSRFYHCESIATNWKRPRDRSPAGLVVDPRTIADLQRLGFDPSEIASDARMQPVKR